MIVHSQHGQALEVRDPLVVVDDAPWRRDAACAEPGPDLWFPERGEPLSPAKAICASCLVASECLDYADVLDIRAGIWGGLTWPERKARRTSSPDRSVAR